MQRCIRLQAGSASLDHGRRDLGTIRVVGDIEYELASLQLQLAIGEAQIHGECDVSHTSHAGLSRQVPSHIVASAKRKLRLLDARLVQG